MTFEEELARALRATLPSEEPRDAKTDRPTTPDCGVPFGPEVLERDTHPTGFAAFRWSRKPTT
ncbi:MAG: hypothetical protein ACXWUG_30245 [Polyangiales bacterium]